MHAGTVTASQFKSVLKAQVILVAPFDGEVYVAQSGTGGTVAVTDILSIAIGGCVPPLLSFIQLKTIRCVVPAYDEGIMTVVFIHVP